MATVAVIINGIEYNLSALYDYRGHDGLGMAPAHRLIERGPQQHGESDVGFRLDPRIFRLFFGLDGETISDLYDKRDAVLRLFRPDDAAMTFKWYLDNGETRQIDAVYESDMALPTAQKQGYYQDVVVAFRAGDPTFYHPVEGSVVFALGGGGDAFNIPWEVPWEIGASVLNQPVTIEYAGSWRTFPIIKIEGPITDCVIENETTGEILDFTGTTISGGDYYEVDCRYGYKTVTDSAGANQIADLTADSDLATFHLAAPLGGAAARENSIFVTGSAVTEATEIYMRYKIRYIGL